MLTENKKIKAAQKEREKNMNAYQKELQQLKPWDEIQDMQPDKEGYNFIYTAGHGYLCIPKNDKNYNIAYKLVKFGFRGDLACYLEEDCEAPAFLKAITAVDNIGGK